MNIAQFRKEFARRGQMTVYERINEDAAKAKAAHFDQMSSLTLAHYRRQLKKKTDSALPAWCFSRADRCWWLDVEKWEFAAISVLSRPTETSAFIRLRMPNGRHTSVWMRFLGEGWREARAVVLARQRVEAPLRVHRQRRHLTLAALA